MGLFDFLKSTPEPQPDWRLLKTIKYEGGIKTGGNKGDDDYKSGDMYYYLFESNIGSRTIQVKTTLRNIDVDKLNEFAKSTEFYHETLYRWLMGRGDPEIPRYDEVDQEETMHALKGTIKEYINPE